MSEPTGKNSPLAVAAAWIVVTLPLAWGIYQTTTKALPLFAGPTEAESPRTPVPRP